MAIEEMRVVFTPMCAHKKQDIKKSWQDEEYSLLIGNLDVLEKWCTRNKKTAFYHFFKTAILASYHRYQSSKRSAWSIVEHIAALACEAALPAVSAGAVYYWSANAKGIFEKSFLFVCAFVIAWISIRSFLEWTKKKNEMETWVRHSACFQHLHNALGRFLYSNQTEDDYNLFVENTFDVLEQNIDQFTLNMSANGIAERKNK